MGEENKNESLDEYQRYITPNSTPFNPLKLAKRTEELITREGYNGLERKYTGIYSAPVYGGIATGYATGCCLRCIYCWSNWSRDFPHEFGTFFSPIEVFHQLLEAAEKGITRWKRFNELKVDKFRLSGCEPTLGRHHLFSLLELVKETEYPFYLETNGILLGAEKDFVKQLQRFSDFLYVRISFKAATPEGFQERTGALGNFYDLPFKALRWLLEGDITARPAAMTDPKVMPEDERRTLLNKLEDIEPSLSRKLEDENLDTYERSIKRLKASKDQEFANDLEKKILG